MADYKQVEKQEKKIDKKYNELVDEANHLVEQGKLKKIEEKYDDLLEIKKSGELDLKDEVMLGIYEDVIKIQKKK
ncbi:MAG: hypothetical protein LLF83_01310 [Methanobacterium sp.]|nr:hypothetical protein [Methanobacterium sp.]